MTTLLSRRPVRALLCLLLSQFLAAAVASAPLVVGIATDYRPLAFKEDGQIAGIEADIAREVARIMGRQLRFVELPFGRLLPALQDGRVDVVMSGLSVTDGRRREVAFAHSYMSVGQMAIIRSADIGRFGHPRAIYQQGVRVGVERGTTGESYAREAMPLVTVQPFRDSDAALAALRARRIDVYIHDAPTSWGIAGSPADADLFSLYRLLTVEELAWAVRKDDPQLLAALNDARDRLEQSGRLQAIQNFWIPVRVEVQ